MRRFSQWAAIISGTAMLAAGCMGKSAEDRASPATTAAQDEGEQGEANLERAQSQLQLRKRASATPAEPEAAPMIGAGAAAPADMDDNEKGGEADLDGAGSRGGKDGRFAQKTPPKGGATKTPEGTTRAWFPETFLFEPLVVTDDAGAATVPVRVPDRLTTWRVLALGHSRSGAQGGAVTSFLGTLPAYVDPVIPPFLVAGDEVRLPIQMINTTAEPLTAELSVSAEGGALTAGRGARTVPAQGSLVEYATLAAARPGAIKLRAALGATDAVERAIEVRPAGRPVSIARSGTLAAPRTLSIEGPAGADPATDRVRLSVFPGALALLRAELAASTARSGVDEDAYALLLAGRAAELLAQLGDKADPEALRTLSIVAGQRAIRHARTLDVPRATALAAAALAHPQSPVLARLGERAAAHLHANQRPDGTFEGGQGWTLQRVLVATADGVRAVAAASGTPAAKQRAQAVAFHAAGAFERNVDAVPDAYTAAAILSSGAAPAALVEKLRERVRAAVTGDAGGKWLDAGEGAVRADGTTPVRAEATALAVLALAGDPKATALRADLGATLLGSYIPAYGWGDGRANLACMQAVLALFQQPLPANVKITLTLDGKEIASGNFDREKLRDVLVLEGPVQPAAAAGAAAASGGTVGASTGIAGAHEWRIAAEPALPGLGFALSLHSYLPWDQAPVKAGLELSLPATITASVGKPTEITLAAVAPSGMDLHITHALPAGVQVDRASLEALTSAGILSRFEISDGKIDLHVPALDPGEVLAAKYRVIPTLGGKLRSGAHQIRAGGHATHAVPTQWLIR